MKTFTLKTREQTIELAQWCTEQIKAHGLVNVAGSHKTIRVEEMSIRSLDQNEMKEMQVKYVASQLNGNDEHSTRLELKYRCGIPILCRDDEKFLGFCKMALSPLSYEERVKAMEFVPVTSEMGVKQMSEYIEKVFDMYAEQIDWGTLGKDKAA